MRLKRYKDKVFSLRIETDINGTPRLYKGDEYLGIATNNELQLWDEIIRLKNVIIELHNDIGLAHDVAHERLKEIGIDVEEVP